MKYPYQDDPKMKGLEECLPEGYPKGGGILLNENSKPHKAGSTGKRKSKTRKRRKPNSFVRNYMET